MTRAVTFIGTVGGIGTSAVVSHLAWMYAEQGTRVLAVDFDRYAGLTKKFFDEERQSDLLDGESVDHVGGVHWLAAPRAEEISPGLIVLVGAPQWTTVDPAGALLRTWLDERAREHDAEVILIYCSGLQDLGKAAVAAADHVVAVVTPDVFSLAGVRALGAWLKVAGVRARPCGYIVGHADGPSRARVGVRQRWIERMVLGYATHIDGASQGTTDPRQDPNCLGIVRSYPSLASMAHEVRKPMFKLTAADGALGSHAAAVRQAYDDFEQLAERVAAATWRIPGATT